MTQIPIAIAEGLLTNLVYNLITQNDEGVEEDEFKFESQN
ncbi:hypothetical protein H477_4089 [[Clostridium] sordellii ATCC 9714]|nr:hypothetical protein H477_4089 [[Clostridium] sordellii ATCC 9714] [Paeniclostridium sordellii ATCC 9714]